MRVRLELRTDGPALWGGQLLVRPKVPHGLDCTLDAQVRQLAADGGLYNVRDATATCTVISAEMRATRIPRAGWAPARPTKEGREVSSPVQIPAMTSMAHGMNQLNCTKHGCREPWVAQLSVFAPAAIEQDPHRAGGEGGRGRRREL